MPKRMASESKSPPSRPAITPEARQDQLIALAVDCAEKQLRDGTASSQVITHYLKLATMKEKVELEILEKKKELIVAQTQNLKSAAHVEELYRDALTAMKKYSGNEEEIDDG